MALTFSSMLPLNTVAPDFSLLDTLSAQFRSLSELKSDKATLLMFMANHCPYVQHIQDGLIQLAHDYQARGVSFIAISANDPAAYPEDGPDKMKERAQTYSYPFVYLFDETQAVAKAYHAECTPDFYVLDRDLRCVYRGRLDDSTPQNGISVTGKDIRAALEAILAGRPVGADQKPSRGCTIKWTQD